MRVVLHLRSLFAQMTDEQLTWFRCEAVMLHQMNAPGAELVAVNARPARHSAAARQWREWATAPGPDAAVPAPAPAVLRRPTRHLVPVRLTRIDRHQSVREILEHGWPPGTVPVPARACPLRWRSVRAWWRLHAALRAAAGVLTTATVAGAMYSCIMVMHLACRMVRPG